MPDSRMLFGRFESFSFNGVKMQYFRAFHIFDIPQDTSDILYVMSVYRAEITNVHSLEDVLLLCDERFQTVSQTDKCLAAIFI